MGVFIIDGMQQLSGEVCVSGGKNAVLPLLAATLLTKEEVTIHNCPMISDVMDMLEILACLGAKTQVSGNTITVCAADICTCAMPEELSHKIRSSIFLLGSMLARKSEACFFAPGGCEIGKRPIDQHIHALGILGVQSETGDGRIICRTHGLKGADIRLRFPSVGATENAMLAASMAQGITRIENAAREPEIVCLAEMMNAMGARVKGAGSMVITIEGVKAMHGTEFTCMPDRIEAGTLLAAVMAAKGNVVLKNTNPQSYASVLETMEAANAKIKRYKSEVELTMHTRPKAFDIETAPYPGFPTDMQAQMCVLACLAEGTSKIKETVFENRLKHLEGLKNAGAQIYTDGRTAFITGKEALLPAEYTARDLRGGAAYVIAALASEGRSSVSCVHFIDRGYEHLENKLKLLGADITRV